MNKAIYVLIFVLVLSIVYADPSFYIKEDEVANITYSCYDEGNYCNSNFVCNLTVKDPNTVILIDNQPMDRASSGSYYNYTLIDNYTNTIGDYYVTTVCSNSSDHGYADFYFRVNKSGENYLGFNLIGIYLILIILVVGYLYSTFNLNKVHIVPKMVMFFMAFVNLIGGLLIAYLDILNYNISDVLLYLLEGNLLALLIWVSFLVIRLLQDSIGMNREKDDLT